MSIFDFMRCYFFLVFIFVINCKLYSQYQNGKVTITFYVNDDSLNSKTIMEGTQPYEIWFKDSLIIYQSFRMRWEQDGNTAPKIWSEVYKYVFFDSRTKSYYEYSSFTDTAKLLDTYSSLNDSLRSGFIPFYKKTYPDSVVDNAKILPDTVIDKKNYSRYEVASTNPIGAKHTTRVYCDCSIRKNIITWLRGFAERKGCPVVKVEEMDSRKPNIKYEYELQTLATSLTAEQMHLFDVWEKYAIKNPVLSNKKSSHR